MDKLENVKYFKRLANLKRFAIFGLVFLDKTRLFPIFVPFINKVMKALGLKKAFNRDLNYRLYAKMFEGDFQKANGDIILFPKNYGVDMMFNVIDLMLAKYLMGKGFKPVFLVCPSASVPISDVERNGRSRHSTPLFSSSLFSGYRHLAKKTKLETYWIDDFFDSDNKLSFEKQCEIIESLDSIKELSSYSFDGTPLGNFARKSVLKYFVIGKFSEVPSEIRVFKRFLKTAVKQHLCTKSLIKHLGKIHTLIVGNGTYVQDQVSINLVVNKGGSFVTHETAFGKNGWIFKKDGICVSWNWDEYWEQFLQETHFGKEKREKALSFLSGLKTGKDMYAILNTSENKTQLHENRYVALFTNLNYDSAVVDKHFIFDSMDDWILEVIDFWEREVEGIKLIIRVHPGELKLRTASTDFVYDKIKDKINSDKIIFYDSTAKVNSYDVIDQIEYGLIYSSTIGIEIAYMGKPCVSAGMPFYFDKPFMFYPKTKESYFQTLRDLNANKSPIEPDKELILRYVYFIYCANQHHIEGLELRSEGGSSKFFFKSSDELQELNAELLENFYMKCFGGAES